MYDACAYLWYTCVCPALENLIGLVQSIPAAAEKPMFHAAGIKTAYIARQFACPVCTIRATEDLAAGVSVALGSTLLQSLIVVY